MNNFTQLYRTHCFDAAWSRVLLWRNPIRRIRYPRKYTPVLNAKYARHLKSLSRNAAPIWRQIVLTEFIECFLVEMHKRSLFYLCNLDAKRSANHLRGSALCNLLSLRMGKADTSSTIRTRHFVIISLEEYSALIQNPNKVKTLFSFVIYIIM